MNEHDRACAARYDPKLSRFRCSCGRFKSHDTTTQSADARLYEIWTSTDPVPPPEKTQP